MRQKDQSSKTETPSGGAGSAAETAGVAEPDRRRFEGLPSAAQRALKEAQVRREKQVGSSGQATEVGGRGGKDPARYGDWEIDGGQSIFETGFKAPLSVLSKGQPSDAEFGPG